MEFNKAKIEKEIDEWKNKITHTAFAKRRVFISIIFLIVILYCSYIWYSFIYNPEWSESEKQEYIELKSKEYGQLNENKFNQTLQDLENRKENYKKSIKVSRDIFGL